MSEKNIEDHCEKSEEEIQCPDEKEKNPMPSQQQEVSAVSVFMVCSSCMRLSLENEM